jgi:hypothetical protein
MQHLFLTILGGVFCSMVFWTFPAASFQNTDLDAVGKHAQETLGPGFRAQNTNSRRVDLTCASCAVPTMVSITIGQQTDGTDERVRGGQTTMADLERLCQAREPSCRVTRADMGPAVGWISVYRNSDTFSGSTLVLIRDGNLMTVRSIAPTPEAARDNVQRLQRAVLPQIVGR